MLQLKEVLKTKFGWSDESFDDRRDGISSTPDKDVKKATEEKGNNLTAQSVLLNSTACGNANCKKKDGLTNKSLQLQLSDALAALRKAGGEKLDLDTDEEEHSDRTARYMDELLKVCNLHYKLGEYRLAGANYFRCYTIAFDWYETSSGRNDAVFFIADMWLKSWMRVDSKNIAIFARVTALILLKKEGCPEYIQQDLLQLEKC